MHNLKTVYQFEVKRTLKKKSFWIMALAFPLMMAAVFAIIMASNKATQDATNAMKNATFSVQITDDSHLISPAVMSAVKATRPASKQAGIAAVQNGTVDAYFYYPANFSNDKIEVYGKDVGLFDNSKYETVAKALLDQSVAGTVNTNAATVLRGQALTSVSTYRNGEPYDSLKEAIAPGLFLVLFYFLIAMFGNQMLTSTTEEKENRVIEMILTTMRAKTLIVGKILSLITLALLQAAIFLVPVLIGYWLLHDQLSLPSLDLANIPLNPVRILSAVAIFAAGFLLFTGLLVTIGAASPTAKEASGFLGIVMLLLFGPLYAITLFVSAPDNPFVRFMTFFPFTATIPALLRNAVGNLSTTDTLLVIGILAVSAVVVMAIAVRVFKSGAIEYSRNLLPAFLQRKR